MHIWLIKDGEKHGPHPDYHIRQGIENGQYNADTPAWHEGLDHWTTLGEIDLFKSTLEDITTLQPPPREHSSDSPPSASARPATTAAAPSTTPEKLHLARRFWARMVDLQIHITVCWMFLYFTNRDIGAILVSPWLALLLMSSWIPIEAALVHFHGTTPGKWLLGIRVRNDDGTPLSGRQSLWRSIRILIAGLGLGLPFVMPLCMIISFWVTHRLRRSLWDHMGGHFLDIKPIRLFRYLAIVAVLFVASQLQVAVLAPHLEPLFKDQFPKFWEQMQQNPPRHFPERQETPGR